MLGGAIGNLTVACFAAGTPLVVDFEGNSRSIEEIEVGDYVLARSEFDAAGPLELKRVEEKFVRVAPVMELVVRGQVITTTAEHPFYVAGEERFVPAGELTLDDQLVDSQGGPIAIDAIRVTDRLITVYNLRVADFHTYFVGGKLWQFDAWVHNAGEPYNPLRIAPQDRFPDSGFDVSINPGRGVTGIDVNYRGTGNVGVVQSTLTRQTGELYIDLVKSQVQRTGLGQELLGRAIRVAEQSGTKVNTVAGHLRGVNKDILLRAGLEATPAYKLRQRAGFTRVIEAPTEANSFSLIMGR